MSKSNHTLRFQLLIRMFLILAMCNTADTMAQMGGSSMSLNAAKANAGNVPSNSSGHHHSYGYTSRNRSAPQLPQFGTLRIEEFINYHHHDLPMPGKNEKVKLSVQQVQLENQKTVLQIGITTVAKLDPEEIRPLNLVMVVDCSGSMDVENRLKRVKKALRAMVERFRPTDKITIVKFSTEASVVLEACEKTKIGKIERAIERLVAGGSTNLHAGLRLGYEQAMKEYDGERTNRVLFLTDGNANVGITDSAAIARMSKPYNLEGVSLSTVGVGSDFDQKLLRKLSDAGKGLAHFVDDKSDIKKIFVNEVESLLSPVARNVCLKIDMGSFANSAKFYGYRPSIDSDHQISIPLENLNAGVTQVVIAELPKKAIKQIEGKGKIKVRATLIYTDEGNNESMQLHAKSSTTEGRRRVNMMRDYSIALLSGGIEKAAKCIESQQPEQARKALQKAVRKADSLMGLRTDKDFARVEEIAQGYLGQLNRYCDYHFAGR